MLKSITLFTMASLQMAVCGEKKKEAMEAVYTSIKEGGRKVPLDLGILGIVG